MNTSKLKWLTDDISEQIPSWMRETDGEYNTYIEFLELYYEWMAQDNNPLGVSAGLLQDSDIDNVSHLFGQYYIKEMAFDMPTVITINNSIDETNESNTRRNKLNLRNRESSTVTYSSDNFVGNGVVSQFNLSHYEPSYYNDKSFLQKVDDISVYINPDLNSFFIPIDANGIPLLSNQVNTTTVPLYNEIDTFGSRSSSDISEFINELRFNPSNIIIEYPRFEFVLGQLGSLYEVVVIYPSYGWTDGVYVLNVGGFDGNDGQGGILEVTVISGSITSPIIIENGSGYNQSSSSLRVDFLNKLNMHGGFGISTNYSILPKFKFEIENSSGALTSVMIDDEYETLISGASLYNVGHSLTPGKYIVEVEDIDGIGRDGQIEFNVSESKSVNEVSIIEPGDSYHLPIITQYIRNYIFYGNGNAVGNEEHIFTIGSVSDPLMSILYLSNIKLDLFDNNIKLFVKFDNGVNKSCTVSGYNTQSSCQLNGGLWEVPYINITNINNDIHVPTGTVFMMFKVEVLDGGVFNNLIFDMKYDMSSGDFVKLPNDYYNIEDGIIVFKDPINETRWVPKSQTVVRVLYRISTTYISKTEIERRSTTNSDNIKVVADRSKLIKFMKSFYSNKGTEQSYKFLFNLFFQKDVDFFYPSKYTFKPSDNTWEIQQSIRCVPFIDRYGVAVNYNDETYNPKLVVGNISGSVATIDRHLSYYIEISPVEEYFISNMVGRFIKGESVTITDNDNNSFTESLYVVISSIDVIHGGSGYNVGESLAFNMIDPGSGSGFDCHVASVRVGSVNGVVVESAGENYITGEVLEFNDLGTGGTGVFGVISSCTSSAEYVSLEWVQDSLARTHSYNIGYHNKIYNSKISTEVEVIISNADDKYDDNILLLDFQTSVLLGGTFYNFGSNNFIDYANNLIIEKNSILLGSFGNHDGVCRVVKDNRVDPILSSISPDLFFANGSLDIVSCHVESSFNQFTFVSGYGLKSGDYYVMISNTNDSTKGNFSPAYLPVSVLTDTDTQSSTYGISVVTILPHSGTEPGIWITGFNIDAENYIVDYSDILTDHTISYEPVDTNMLNSHSCLVDKGIYTPSTGSDENYHVFDKTEHMTFGDDGDGYVKINGVGELLSPEFNAADDKTYKFTIDFWYHPNFNYNLNPPNWSDEEVIFSLASQYISETPNKLTLVQREFNDKLKFVLVLGPEGHQTELSMDMEDAGVIDYDNVEVSDSGWIHITVEIDFQSSVASLYLNGKATSMTYLKSFVITDGGELYTCNITEGPYANDWQSMVYSWDNAINAVIHEINSINDSNITSKDDELKLFLQESVNGVVRYDINENSDTSDDIDIITEMLNSKKYYWAFYINIISEMLTKSEFDKYFITEGTHLEDEFLIGARRSIVSETNSGSIIIPIESTTHCNGDFATFRITKGHRFDKLPDDTEDTNNYLRMWTANPMIYSRIINSNEYFINDQILDEITGLYSDSYITIYKNVNRINPVMSDLHFDYWEETDTDEKLGKLKETPSNGKLWSDIIFSNGYGLVSGVYHVIISSKPHFGIPDLFGAAKIPVNVVLDVTTGVSTITIILPVGGDISFWTFGAEVKWEVQNHNVDYYLLKDIKEHNNVYRDINNIWDDGTKEGHIRIPLMLPDWYTVSLKYHNLSVGGISSLHLYSSGSGYKTLPSVGVSDKSGDYVSKGSGAILRCVSDDIGGISTVAIGSYVTGLANRWDDFGIGYEVTPILDLVSKGNGNAEIKLNTGIVCSRVGYSLSEKDSMPSNSVKCQDSMLWQDYSYVLRSTVTIDKWRDIIKKVIHPAGFEVFGEFVLEADTFIRSSKTKGVPYLRFHIIKNVEITVDVMDGLGVWTKGLEKDDISGDIVYKTDVVNVNNLYSGGHHNTVRYDNLQSTVSGLKSGLDVDSDPSGISHYPDYRLGAGRYALFGSHNLDTVTPPGNILTDSAGIEVTIDLKRTFGPYLRVHIDSWKDDALELRQVFGHAVSGTNLNDVKIQVTFDNKESWVDLGHGSPVDVPDYNIGYAKIRVTEIPIGTSFNYVEILRWSHDFGVGGSYASDTNIIYYDSTLDESNLVDNMSWQEIRYVGVNHISYISNYFTKYRDTNVVNKNEYDMVDFYNDDIIGTNFTIFKNRSVMNYNTSSWNWGKFIIVGIEYHQDDKYIIFTVKHIESSGNIPIGEGAGGYYGENSSAYDYPNDVEFRFDSISRSGVDESSNFWVGSQRSGSDVRDDKMVIRLHKYWEDVPSLGVTSKSLERTKFRFLGGNEYRDVLSHRFTDPDEILVSPHLNYRPESAIMVDGKRIYTGYKKLYDSRVVVDISLDEDGDGNSSERLWSSHIVSNEWKYNNVDTGRIIMAINKEIRQHIRGRDPVNYELYEFLQEKIDGVARWDVNSSGIASLRDMHIIQNHGLNMRNLNIEESQLVTDVILNPIIQSGRFDHYLYKSSGITDYTDHLWPTTSIQSLESMYDRNYHAVIDSALSIRPKRLFITLENNNNTMNAITLGMNWKGLERMKFYNTPQWYKDNELFGVTQDMIESNFHKRINIGHEPVVFISKVNTSISSNVNDMCHFSNGQIDTLFELVQSRISTWNNTRSQGGDPPLGFLSSVDNSQYGEDWENIYNDALRYAFSIVKMERVYNSDINNRKELID